MVITQTLKSKAAPVVCIAFLWALSSGLLGLTLPLYLAGAGHTPREWGLLAGAGALAMVFAEPAWGWLSDRLGIAAPLAVSLSTSALLAPIFLLTGSLPILLAVQLLRGLIQVAAAPVCRKALANALGPGRQAAGLGLFQASVTAGSGAGSLLGGYVVGLWGYAPAFILASALPLAALALTLAGRAGLGALNGAAPVPAPAPVEGAAPARPQVRGVIVRFLGLALIGMCLFVGSSAARSFLPILSTSVLGLGASQVGLLLTLTSLLSGLLMVFVGRLSDRWGRRPLVVGGLLLLSASLVAYGQAGSLAGLVAAGVVSSLGLAAGVPAALALASDIAPPGRQGQIIGLYGSCEDVGMMLGPVVCGFLWDGYGPRIAFTACAFIVGLGALVALAMPEKRG